MYAQSSLDQGGRREGQQANAETPKLLKPGIIEAHPATWPTATTTSWKHQCHLSISIAHSPLK